MKWCLSNQFDIKDIIYQADKTKLSYIKKFSTGTYSSVKPYLENKNETTTTTTTTTTPPTTGTSTITITTRITATAVTAATLEQNSNSEDVLVSPECNKTP